MSNPANIYASNWRIGEITFGSNPVYGEGGAYDARLVVPLMVRMQPRIAEEMIALTEIRCTLHLSEPAFAQNQCGPMVVINLLPHFWARSLPSGTSEHHFEVRLPLSPALLVQLENHRHQDAENMFRGILQLEVTAAWLYDTQQDYKQDPLKGQLGLHSKLAYLWNIKVDNLTLWIPASEWVQRVLPGVGLNALRLIEVAMPVSDKLIPLAALTAFDAARRDYDLGNYQGCIEHCRAVYGALHDHFGIMTDAPLGKTVAEQWGLAPDAVQGQFLTGLWQAVVDLLHGIKAPAPSQRLAPADVHACLLALAVLLDYLGKPR